MFISSHPSTTEVSNLFPGRLSIVHVLHASEGPVQLEGRRHAEGVSSQRRLEALLELIWWAMSLAGA